MKKLFLTGCFGLLLSLTACDQKDGYTTSTKSIYAHAINIITDLNDESVVVNGGYYLFSLEMSTQTGMTGTVTSPELIANNTNLAFTTELQDYLSAGYDAYFDNAQGTVTGNSTFSLNNAKLEAVYLYDATENPYNGYYYNLSDVGELTYKINGQFPWIAVAKYNIGSDYRINTFQPDSFFSGTTTTTYNYQGQQQVYETDKIMYRFIIEPNEKYTEFTATLIMYDAKFSSVAAEPTKTIVVKDLNVSFASDGIKITGENLIPEMYSKAEGFVPMERFIFNNFEFHTTDSYYIYGAMTYQVAGTYYGSFEGSYMKSYFLK